MNLTQLRYFQTVCRHGSITSAVEELQVSQPSVSSAIRALEEEFGVPFFERQHRGMVPTEEGKQFLLLTDSLLDAGGEPAEKSAASWDDAPGRLGDYAADL